MAIKHGSKAYNAISTQLSPADHAVQLWWNRAGRPIASLMEQAGYTDTSQRRHLEVFQKLIAPFLGSMSQNKAHNVWPSFMTDNHFPVELSLCWNSKGTPSVKYSFEPIGEHAGSSNDRLNVQAMPRFLEVATTSFAGKHNLESFRSLENILVSRKVTENCGSANCADLGQSRHLSQYFAAVDLFENDLLLKAYLMPELKAHLSGRTKSELTTEAMNALGPIVLQPWSIIQEYFADMNKLQGYTPSVEIIATDCTAPASSRIKVYFRSLSTSFRSVKDMMLLGGRLCDSVDAASMNRLATLWHLLLDHSTDSISGGKNWEDLDLPLNSHHTAGILYYFELRPDSPVPWPKVYIPVRHYAKDDEAVTSGLEEFLRRNSDVFQDWSQKYRPMVHEAL